MSGTGKKILASLAVVMFIASAVCIVADNKGCEATDYDVTIELGTENISAGDFKAQFGGNGKSHYDYSGTTGTLTLDNFEFTTDNSVAIYSSVNTVIKVIGSNKIVSGGTGGNVSACINVESSFATFNSVTITGDTSSKLELISGNTTTKDTSSVCIKCDFDVMVSGGLTLHITLDSATNETIGISAKNVSISDSTVMIDAYSDSANMIEGISGNIITIADSVVEMGFDDNTCMSIVGIDGYNLGNDVGTLHISGKKTHVKIDIDNVIGQGKYGVMSSAINMANIIIDEGAVVEANGGKVTATGDNGIAASCGIVSYNMIEITDAVVTATAGTITADKAAENIDKISAGIFVQVSKGAYSISGSTLYITGDAITPSDENCMSYGIYSSSEMILSDDNIIKTIRGYTGSVSDHVTLQLEDPKEFEGRKSLTTEKYVPLKEPLSDYKEIRTVGNIITYDFNDGVTPAIGEWHPNGEIVTISDCTVVREGYEFKGWTDGTDVYQPGSTYNMTKEPLKLTAIWEKTDPEKPFSDNWYVNLLLVSLLLVTVIAIAIMYMRRYN